MKVNRSTHGVELKQARSRRDLDGLTTSMKRRVAFSFETAESILPNNWVMAPLAREKSQFKMTPSASGIPRALLIQPGTGWNRSLNECGSRCEFMGQHIHQGSTGKIQHQVESTIPIALIRNLQPSRLLGDVCAKKHSPFACWEWMYFQARMMILRVALRVIRVYVSPA